MNQEKKKCGRNPQKKLLLLVTHVICAAILAATLIIPVKGKKVLFSNTDISMYHELESVPVIGSITDRRPAEICFELYGEKLYGICLYFCVEGSEYLSEENGAKLVCTLKAGEEQIGHTEVTAKELVALMGEESLNAKELVFDCTEPLNGEYTLRLEGEGIPAGTRIALYANKGVERRLDYKNAGYDRYTEILYSVEAATREHPFVWNAALLWTMVFLFGCIISMNGGEKN